MLQRPRCQVITLEEHYWDQALAKDYTGPDSTRDPELARRLYDLGELRLKEMDEAGIDVQVLSHGAPATQKLTGDAAVALTRQVNDRLHADRQRSSQALCRFRSAADVGPGGRRR